MWEKKQRADRTYWILFALFTVAVITTQLLTQAMNRSIADMAQGEGGPLFPSAAAVASFATGMIGLFAFPINAVLLGRYRLRLGILAAVPDWLGYGYANWVIFRCFWIMDGKNIALFLFDFLFTAAFPFLCIGFSQCFRRLRFGILGYGVAVNVISLLFSFVRIWITEDFSILLRVLPSQLLRRAIITAFTCLLFWALERKRARGLST